MRATMTDAPRRVASPVAHQCRASAGLLQRRAPKASEASISTLSHSISSSQLLLRRRRVKLSASSSREESNSLVSCSSLSIGDTGVLAGQPLDRCCSHFQYM
ncbi:vegetative cell wall protein gp1-like [Iris pallida]|uniref:Vegetative cell wall protein gp1-like n=1 Tax=Iris pallida TaxID=29817 RepID=A0AAX6EBG8_IRIPA|nr:vegetative cell wall protein gp1-like [Iris pallida]